MFLGFSSVEIDYIWIGIGGDCGWGLIGDHTERAITEIAAVMEASLVKLFNLQKDMKEDPSEK